MLVRDMPFPRRVVHWGIWRLKALDNRIRVLYADCKKCGDSGAYAVDGGPFMADCPCRAGQTGWDF